jgi:hypothetical protein
MRFIAFSVGPGGTGGNGKVETERAPLAVFASHTDLTTVPAHGVLHYSQPESASLWPSTETGVHPVELAKDPPLFVFRDPDTVIRHCHFH